MILQRHAFRHEARALALERLGYPTSYARLTADLRGRLVAGSELCLAFGALDDRFHFALVLG